jgi:GDP-D-mannose 3',5'-epimerase
MNRILVTGAAGFIGHHLCRYLKERGYWVRAVDYRESDYEVIANEIDWSCDLRILDHAISAVHGMDEVYAFAADMGGMSYVGSGGNDLDIMENNTAINLNTLWAARREGIKRYLFSSSACVYNANLQTQAKALMLREEDVYPAWPDTPYGWEKLYTERLCEQYALHTDMEIRITRFHNIYGPEGTWCGGREKAPAWISRLVAEQKLGVADIATVQLHGDGQQTRSFCYIDDCLDMLYALMQSDHPEPLNVGTDRAISMNDLAYLIADIAGIDISISYDPDAPVGVRGRNADLTRMRQVLGIEPRVSLEEGLTATYQWIEEQVKCQMSQS